MSNIIDITDRISDKEALAALKDELCKAKEAHTYQVNFGYDRNINDYQKMLTKMNPYDMPQNYSKGAIKAKGQWRDIYEIAFGAGTKTITTEIENDEISEIVDEITNTHRQAKIIEFKPSQRKTKEAA